MSALAKVKRAIRSVLPERPLALHWIKKEPDSWLAKNLPSDSISIPATGVHRSFERVAAQINGRGALPLWDGYKAAYERDSTVPWANASMERLPDQVRTQPQMGRLFAKIAELRKPSLIVEVGTAFGVSAMYWASGLQKSGSGGRLLTFDPNPVWHNIAADHLRAFEDTVESVLGTFESQIDSRLNGSKISVAFVDAIHTDSFVSSQVEMLLIRCESSPIIILDDISFSDDMKASWIKWAHDKRVLSSVAVADRVGIIEFAS